jgi:uncharacterized protein YdcH (DUF465 family)
MVKNKDKKDNKRKHSNDTGSDTGANQVNNPVKNPRNGVSPILIQNTLQTDQSYDQNNGSVSDTIRQANSVLFCESDFSLLDNSVFGTPTPFPDRRANSSMANSGNDATGANLVKGQRDTGKQVGSSELFVVPPEVTVEKGSPTEAINNYLQRIELKINHVDKRLNAFDNLEEKVSKLELDLNKLYNFVHDQNKKLDEKVNTIDDRVSAIEFTLGTTNSELDMLRKDEIKTKDELIYLKSQSMRNNLVFGNIPEPRAETWEQSEATLREFMNSNLKIASDLVDAIKFECVHRMGNFSATSAYPKKLVAKFVFFKDREYVRRQREHLQDSDFFLHEQFPPEIAARRRAHIPAVKAAKRQGKRAWLSYDTLYVDGKPVPSSDANSSGRGR